MTKSTKTIREAIRLAIEHCMSQDERVFVIGEEVGEYQGAYKVTQGLLQKFGKNRIIDTPISEHGFAGIAVGAALAGLRPIVEFMTFNFAMQAIDQIINSAAKTFYMSGGTLNCPIVFRGPNGAAARVAAQHSQNYAAWYSHVPGLKVMLPYDANDHYNMLIEAIKDPNPVIFLENELLYGKEFEFDPASDQTPINKAKVVRSGSSATVITFGIQVGIALHAAQELIKDGVDVEVIDLRHIAPIDLDTVIASVQKTGRVLILEEGWFMSGVAPSISSLITSNAFDYLDAPPLCVNAKPVPLPYAANLEKLALPTLEDVISGIKNICYL